MRVTIVSCSYYMNLLYEYLLKLKKNCPRPCPRPRDFVFGLVLVLGVLSSSSASSSGVWPRSTSLVCIDRMVVNDVSLSTAGDCVHYSDASWLRADGDVHPALSGPVCSVVMVSYASADTVIIKMMFWYSGRLIVTVLPSPVLSICMLTVVHGTYYGAANAFITINNCRLICCTSTLVMELFWRFCIIHICNDICSQVP